MDSRASAVPDVPVPDYLHKEREVRERACTLIEQLRHASSTQALQIMSDVEQLLDFADDLHYEQMRTDQSPGVCAQGK